MNIFKTWTLKWWEVGITKLCLISLGIILAIYFYSYLVPLLLLWWVIFVVTTAYLMFVWAKQQ